MALFRRKKNVDAAGMPTEIQDYYQAENRERTWMAWVLGLGTLVVTVLIALALFFGGRWVYRKVRNQPANVTTTQNQPAQGTVEESKEGEENKQGDSSTSNTAPNPTNGSTATPPSTTTPTTGTSSTSTSTPGNATTPGTTSSTAIPNTGPADTLAIFVGATVVAYAVHRRFLND